MFLIALLIGRGVMRPKCGGHGPANVIIMAHTRGGQKQSEPLNEPVH